MLGVSIYLNKDLGAEDYAYLKKAKESGFEFVFTSLHIPEDDVTKLRARFQQAARMCRELGLELSADVSAFSLQRIGSSFEETEELAEWGVTGLRIDAGIPPGQTASVSQKLNTALNASTLRENDWAALVREGICSQNAEAWHNFYPRPETGLGSRFFKEKNAWLHSLGLTVMAFVPGDGKKRGPLFQGLPTLEKHRHKPPFAAALDLMNSFHVQKVCVGDPLLSDAALEQFAFYKKSGIMLRAKSYADTSAYEQKQTNRLDAARDCIRSVESRQLSKQPPAPFHTIARKKGAVTVDNERYGRYAGELQIVLRDLPADEKINVIGQIDEQDLPLLPCIGPGQSFLIKWN